MKSIFLFIILAAAIILQISVLPFAGALSVINPVLAFCLILIVRRGFKNSWKIIAVAAVLIDMFSLVPFGLISLCIISVCWLADIANRFLFSGNGFLTNLCLFFLSVLLYDFALFFLTDLFQLSLGWQWQSRLIGAILNAIIGVTLIRRLKTRP